MGLSWKEVLGADHLLHRLHFGLTSAFVTRGGLELKGLRGTNALGKTCVMILVTGIWEGNLGGTAVRRCHNSIIAPWP